jgi:hypothetical protein
MPNYLIRLIFSEPANAGEKAKSVEKEMEIPNDQIASERAFYFMIRENTLDKSVIGVQVYRKNRSLNKLELVREIKLSVG